MKHSISSLLAAGAALLLALKATPTRAAATILHNFTASASDGAAPYGSLTLSGSKLYGMTVQGGVSDEGTIFGMNTDGTGFSLLHSFGGNPSDGREPFGSLTLSGSKFYGMTKYGGGSSDGGVVFSMNLDGTGYSLLHTFTGGLNDGRLGSNGALTLSGTKVYGMTQSGGTGRGVLFSMNTDGTGYSLLHTFTGAASDAGSPNGSLTLLGSKLYGMTVFGGSKDKGALFSINTDGTGFNLLHSFTGAGTDGALPYGDLTLSGSKFYSMTLEGGSSNHGTVFSIGIDGTAFSLLHSFTGSPNDGADPRGSLALSGSTLYGMTERGGTNTAGTLFSIGTDGTGFGLLENFGDTPKDGVFLSRAHRQSPAMARRSTA